MKQKLFDMKMNEKPRNLDFKLNNQEKKQKQPFHFQRDMNEQMLIIKEMFDEQRFQ
jgi:hypothetical protein